MCVGQDKILVPEREGAQRVERVVELARLISVRRSYGKVCVCHCNTSDLAEALDERRAGAKSKILSGYLISVFTVLRLEGRICPNK